MEWGRDNDITERRKKTFEKVKKLNPSIKTPLDDCPSLDIDEYQFLRAYDLSRIPSRYEQRPMYPSDILPVIQIYQPDNAKEFADDILAIESKLCRHSEESSE